MSARDWWGSDGRSPRHFAEALLVMRGDPERQKKFMETHVPENEDFRAMVRDHYRTALALGGNK